MPCRATLCVSLVVGTGLFQLGFAVVTVIAVVAVKGKPLMALALVLAAARAALEALHQMTDLAALATAGGCVALALSAVAIFTGAALLGKHMWPEPVLPIFRRGRLAAAVSGQVVLSSLSMSDQPGVRGEL